MRIRTKIEAFTLSEMSVVLVITAIVVGIAFSVLSLVQKHMYSIQGNFEKTIELHKLKQALWVDFHKYERINYNESDDLIKFSSELDSITYNFTSDRVIRKRDTFHIVLANKVFYFDGEIKEEGLIDAVKLEASKEFQNRKIFVFNYNDAAAFMN